MSHLCVTGGQTPCVGGKMTNETLRGRLSIAASNYSIASRIISDTIAAGLIKLEDSSKSRKYAQYIPIWA